MFSRFIDGWNHIRSFLAELFEVEMLDVLWERHLPWLLIVVVQLAELLGIYPQLAGHLDLDVK